VESRASAEDEYGANLAVVTARGRMLIGARPASWTLTRDFPGPDRALRALCAPSLETGVIICLRTDASVDDAAAARLPQLIPLWWWPGAYTGVWTLSRP
jgi:hypothetical protein